MNQILVTGEERVKNKVKKEKKTASIKGVSAFFALSIILLGICMISGSVYARDKINEVVVASAKPQVEINRNDENNTVEINVKHIRGITKITYRWNDEEEKVIEGKNRKNVLETIDLIGGENTLTVGITEENGQTVTYEKKYKVGNIPVIKLSAVSNGIQVTATSEAKIDYIVYNWDDGEEQKITVGEKKYEGVINTPKGLHTLKIRVVDINKMEAKLEQAVVGDTEPTVEPTPQWINGKATYVIDASDDEGIKTIEIIHNGGAKEVIEVNAKTFHKELLMTSGENTLIVTAINVNGLQKTRRVRTDNKY